MEIGKVFFLTDETSTKTLNWNERKGSNKKRKEHLNCDNKIPSAFSLLTLWLSFIVSTSLFTSADHNSVFFYSTRIGQETRPCTMHQLVIQHLNAIKCLHSLQKKDKNNMFTTFSFRSFNAVFFVFVCVLSFFSIQSPLFLIVVMTNHIMRINDAS